MTDKEPYNQQGDIFLYQTLNGGNVTAQDGLLQMTGGLPTAAYLSMFGGNFEDAGGSDKSQSWWANVQENEKAKQYRSETQFLLESLPAIPANLRRIESAVIGDLQWLLDSKIASTLSAVATMPALNRVKIEINIYAYGQEQNFSFVEAWRAGGFEPILLPLAPEWRVLENYYPRLTENGDTRIMEP